MATTADPEARLLDLTRLVSRAGRHLTGVDRVERAYLENLLADPVPLWGLVRTSLGFLLLDHDGCAAVSNHIERADWPNPRLIDRIARRSNIDRAGAEGRLRRISVGRARACRLGLLLRRALPDRTHYINVGHTALSVALVQGLRALPGLRIGVMIHDTIPLDWPQHQRPGTPERFAHFLTRAAAEADVIIANSAVTEADIKRHLNAATPETVVAHLGVPRPDAGVAPQGPWTGEPYFVVLGTIEPRKNHAFLLDLWQSLGPDAPRLIICGARGWENHETFERLDQGPPQVHELNDLDDPALFALLRGSAGLLFPSLAEGYGLPLLEAASLGVPCLCNDLPVFREIAGEFPIYAAVSDPYLWKKEIMRLRHDADARQDRTEGQRAELTPPSWASHFKTVLTRI